MKNMKKLLSSRSVLQLIFLLIVLVLHSCRPEPKDYMVFHGAAETIGGSCIELVFDGKHYLVDAGSWYGSDEMQGDEDRGSCQERMSTYRRNSQFSFEPESVRAVLLTHAHLDHSGRLIYLFREGFRGKIYSTHATADLAAVMLLNAIRYDQVPRKWKWSPGTQAGRDFVTVHWETCQYQRRIRKPKTFNGSLCNLEKHIHSRSRKKVNPCRECATFERDRIMDLFSIVEFRTPISIDQGITATFYPAHHIPGSAAVLVELQKGSLVHTILFSGDVGNDIQLLYDKPEIFPQADWVVIEGTYGHLIRERNYLSKRQEFAVTIGQALQQGNIVWIPSFALDRTQKILHEIYRAIQEGFIDPQTPVYVPSPTAQKINDYYESWALRPAGEGLLHPSLAGQRIFPSYIREMPENAGNSRGPAIFVTTSGMLDAAYSAALLSDFLPRRDVLLLFVGYQSQSSPGGKILAGEPLIRWDEKSIPVNLTWKKFDFFSGHGDLADILYMLSENQQSRIFLNHGEKSSLEQMKQNLRERDFTNVQIARESVKYPIEWETSGFSAE